MDYDIKGIMGENAVTTWKDVRETLEELKQAVEEMRKASKALLEEVSKPWIVR
jgi:predicted nuclease with TOPRIM domain